MRAHLSVSLAALLSMFAAPASAASLQRLDDLVGLSYCTPTGVSDDGSYLVVQWGEAFRMARGGGLIGLGTLGGMPFYSTAHGVSSDGSVIAGWSISASGQEAFRWTEAGGMVGLGDLPGGRFESGANHVSGDGAVVVGLSDSSAGYEAFRWTETTGMVGLGDLPGGEARSAAASTSDDGSVVVGYGETALGAEAFRWTEAGGMVGLGDLPGGGFGSGAAAVSGDGATVVGVAYSANGWEPFRWTSGDGMVSLGLLPGAHFKEGRASGVSDDGSVIVGYCDYASEIATGREAFLWTSTGGMEPLWDVLLAAGVDPAATGWTALNVATVISGDGSTIMGWGLHNGFEQGFLAFLSVPEPSSLAVVSLALPLLLRRRRRAADNQALMDRY